MSRAISKSKYVAGLQCLKRLWIEIKPQQQSTGCAGFQDSQGVSPRTHGSIYIPALALRA